MLKPKEVPAPASSKSTDIDIVEVKMPALEVRWAHTGTKQLALPTAPVTGLDTNFKAFSADESDRIEAAWQSMSAAQRQAAVELWGKGDGEWSEDTKKAKKKKSAKKSATRVSSSVSVTSASESEAPSADEAVPEKEEQYKSIIEKAQSDTSRLDSVEGVPVSQVC